MRQVIERTLGRVLTGQELWNGNRENWRAVLSRDPTKSIIVWAWQNHGRFRDRYLTAMSDPQYRHLRFVRLCTRREAATMLAQVEPVPRLSRGD